MALDPETETEIRRIIRDELDEHEALRSNRTPEGYARIRAAIAEDRGTIERQRKGEWPYADVVRESGGH